jgi:primosomal protein N' (replication factor Y)
MFAKVAVDYPIKNQGLTYQIPESLVLFVGDIVEVPLGRRVELGCVLEIVSTVDEGIKVKEVIQKREDYPRLEKSSLELFSWMAQYYHYSAGKLIVDSLPLSKKKPKPLEPVPPIPNAPKITPNKIQQEIIEGISENLDTFSKHLIHGVTGAGKTVIYLELIKKIIAQNKSALYLLPEINLTPQFVATFSQSVDCEIYTFHSEITDSQKFNIWHKASSTEKPVLFIGVRSSVFLPIKNLGLIIVDEEHDNSFKQDDRCTYNARDVAIKKAQITNCPVIMGSATPALETFNHFNTAKTPKTFYWKLENRVENASLPEIVLLDTRTKVPSEEDIWPFHPESIRILKEAIAQKEQCLVFINRLGYANYVQCRACGHQFFCKNCSVTLRYFKQKNILSCQHCEYHEPMPQGCPECSNLTLIQKGFGTEKVQEVLRKVIPQARSERFDRDIIKNLTELKKRLDEFHRGDVDILVGTQMLSKGHNFKKVKKVIILGVDNQLNLPDFRANEKIYQTVVQVAGRAGRYSEDGKVYIQTANPEAQLFDTIKSASFDGFYKIELPIRQLCECPPFYKIAAMYFSGRDQSKLSVFVTQKIDTMLKGMQRQHFSEVMILGPRPALLEKRANQFTWTVLLKSKDFNQLHNLIQTFESNVQMISGVSLKIDIDPQHIS